MPQPAHRCRWTSCADRRSLQHPQSLQHRCCTKRRTRRTMQRRQRIFRSSRHSSILSRAGPASRCTHARRPPRSMPCSGPIASTPPPRSGRGSRSSVLSSICGIDMPLCCPCASSRIRSCVARDREHVTWVLRARSASVKRSRIAHRECCARILRQSANDWHRARLGGDICCFAAHLA